MSGLLRNVTAILTATALMLVGCSHPDGSPGSSAAEAPSADADNASLPDPCTVLPAATVAAIFESAMPDQGTFTVTTKQDSAAETWCNITLDSKFTKSKLFTVDVFDGDRLDAEKQDRRAAWKPIAGVGDEAYEVQGDYYVRVGKVGVHFFGVGDADVNVALLRAASEHL